MKMQAGDKVWVTKADDVNVSGLNYNVHKALYVEWDGKKFLGCLVPFDAPTARATWAIDLMRHYQEENCEKPETRTNIDCMFEQLDAEGAFG